MPSYQALPLILALCIQSSNGFSIRPPVVAAPLSASALSTRGTTTTPPTLHQSSASIQRQRNRPNHHGALFASSSSNNNIIPYYDELMERLPSNKKVIEAVEKANGAPIVASDLATSAGISLSQARKDLTTLASLTRGDIAVSSDGELLYTFPSGVNSVLSSNSAKYRAVSTWNEKIVPPLFYATKVRFWIVIGYCNPSRYTMRISRLGVIQ